jgi:hypothetical protein
MSQNEDENKYKFSHMFVGGGEVRVRGEDPQSYEDYADGKVTEINVYSLWFIVV